MAIVDVQPADAVSFGEHTLVDAGASGSGAGDAHALPFMCDKFTVEFSYTGSPTAVSDIIQGSMDGSTWFDLYTNTTIAGQTVHIVNKPVRYIRGNVGTMTGGTAPTCTIKAMGARV